MTSTLKTDRPALLTQNEPAAAFGSADSRFAAPTLPGAPTPQASRGKFHEQLQQLAPRDDQAPPAAPVAKQKPLAPSSANRSKGSEATATPLRQRPNQNVERSSASDGQPSRTDAPAEDKRAQKPRSGTNGFDPRRADAPREAVPAGARQAEAKTPATPGVQPPTAAPQATSIANPQTPVGTLASAGNNLPTAEPALAAEALQPPTSLIVPPGIEDLAAALTMNQAALITPTAMLDPQLQPAQLAPVLPPEAQQLLQTLTFTLGGSDALVAQSPALLLLSGRLDQLSPTAIPTIVSDSPLLQDILSSASPEQLMQQAAPIGAILQELGLGSSALATRIAGTKLEGLSSSLQDVLKTLGIDADRIIKEANLLQQTIPVDGLQPYMLRAAKLQGQKHGREDEALAGAMAVAGSLPLSNLRPAKPEATVAQAQPATAAIRPAALPPTAPAALDALPIQDEPATAASMLPVELATSELNPSNPIASKPTLAPPAPLAPLHTETLVATSWSLDLPPPLAFAAPQDPFAALAQIWQKEDVQRLDLSPELSSTPAASQDLAPIWGKFDGALGVPLIADGANSAGGLAPRSSAPGLDFSQALASLTLTESDSGLASGNSERDSSDSQAFAQKDGTPDLSFNLGPQATTTGASSFQVQEAKAPAPPPQVSQESMQKIFQSASMMLKEGGGSIRIDMGAEGLGTLDLALDIKDKSVDLRIIASSSHVRELLTHELPKLRESLLGQNLNLEKVEIGLGGGSAWSQSSGDGRQARGQNYESMQQASYRSPSGRSSEVRSYHQASGVRDLNLGPLHPGLIQVRV